VCIVTTRLQTVTEILLSELQAKIYSYVPELNNSNVIQRKFSDSHDILHMYGFLHCVVTFNVSGECVPSIGMAPQFGSYGS
jgi:hypothetical protein